MNISIVIAKGFSLEATFATLLCLGSPRRLRLLAMTTFVWCSCAMAAPYWEIAVAFLGSDENPEYQSDIDRNVMELAKLVPGKDLKISLYREFPKRRVAFFPNPSSSQLHPLTKLLHDFEGKLDVAGALDEKMRLDEFLQKSFTRKPGRRMLVLYGHGFGYDGLKGIPLPALRKKLAGLNLDILWLDACFMAAPEVTAELHGTAKILVASEEAEFSAGAPFDVLQESLDWIPEVTAKKLAERFLESYSYIRRGKQSDVIQRTSATISVLDLGKMESLYPVLKQWNGELARQFQAKKIQKLRMEKEDLVDLGAMLQTFPESVPARELISTLELGAAKERKTNPRLKVEAPEPGSLLVFGYEEWSRGNNRDDAVLDVLPEELKPTTFVDGWPARPLNVRLYLTPFTVGLNRFDYYFADARTEQPLTEPRWFERHQDYVIRAARLEKNPLRFTGYTQGIGDAAERYTGLSVFAPGRGRSVPSLDYIDLRFFQLTGWANF